MSVSENIAVIRVAVEKAARANGHDPAQTRIVAVSKKQPQEKIIDALEAGHRLFGENRVQEAQAHWGDLRKKYPDLRLHLIGPLQTNKVKEAVALFDVIETIDREKLAQALANEIKKQGKDIKCLIQVNTGDEEQKSGVTPEGLPELLKICEECGLHVAGLMCIPPLDDPPALHFALLKKLARENNLKELGMGMSGDYEKAVALGATYIRLGTAIFGEREAI